MKAANLLQVLTLRGHSFFPAPIGEDSTVLDLGANRGDFSKQVTSRFGCRCVAVEANPELLAPLRQIANIEVVHAAVAETAGELPFHLSGNSEASSIHSGVMQPTGHRVMVSSVTLSELMSRCGIDRVALIKADIEGAEIGVFRTADEATLSRIDQITVEFHDFLGLGTAVEIDAVRRRLESAGFVAIRFSEDNTNWLFVRRTLPGFSLLRRFYVTQVVRNSRLLLHRLRRMTGRRLIGLSSE